MRPFPSEAGITNRSCSLPLQRVVTDFGADVPFGRVPEKLKEHYGIEVGTSTIRRLTERHARAFYDHAAWRQALPLAGRPAPVIAEMDGGMVPVVESDPQAPDKRKGKRVQWNEVKICLAHPHESKDIVFGGTFQGGVKAAGEEFRHCVMAAGFGADAPLHAIADGASWIAEQIDEHFGTQGHYLVDFYHVCDYLAAAAKGCSSDPDTWLEQQKNELKANRSHTVLAALLPHIEASTLEDQNAPVRKAYRYLHNRRHQLDYQGALEKKLPIGSGEIESAHRYLVQQRLKRPGAWWTPENINFMLALRLARANRRWDDYWKRCEAKDSAA